MRRAFLPTVGAFVAGYVVGSVPSGVWLVRMSRGLDVRDHGSGSMGTTNVLRVAGPVAAIGTLAVDLGKGAVPALAVRAGGGRPAVQAAASLGAVVGHAWPALARFRGGKGVATGFGGLLVVAPEVAGWTVIAASVGLAATRKMSVGSLLATGAAVVSSRAAGRAVPRGYAALVATVILVRHYDNVRRLIRGEELSVGRSHENVFNNSRTSGPPLRPPR